MNHLIGLCQVRPVEEGLAREAAALRTATARAGTVSAVDAIVVALAATVDGANVLTSDPSDLQALANHSESQPAIAAV